MSKKSLEQREKPELIAIIQHMLCQEPDLQWLLMTPLPTASAQKSSIDPKVYREQVLSAMAAGENQRKRGEVERRLTALKTIADEFAAQENYVAALTIYEVLIIEVIQHFNDYRDEYIAFNSMLTGCIDGLDSCFAGEEDNLEIRLRVLRMLFAIYRFYTESGMDLDEDIPGLLLGNTTLEERQSKAQLITLIRQLLQKQPEVEWQLTMAPFPGHKYVPIDVEAYRDQVDEAFHNAGREWDAVYGISSDLSHITETAARFFRRQDYSNAAAIYEVVASGILSHYLSYHDEDGALGRVVQECVESLGACLEGEREDEALCKQILEAIFAVYRFDVDHGGFGLTKDIPPEFLQNTTPEEKHLVAQWVRTALAELQEKKQESEWRRQRYGGLLLALEADVLGDDEFLRVGRETKSIQAVVIRLLELGRIDEAVQDASQTNGWQLVKLADLFVQYGQGRAVERMMYEMAQQERHTLYQQHVERLIAGRANYQAACSYLGKIRSLYEKIDEAEQWTAYIAWVRKQHSRLSTLKAELTAANVEGEMK